VNGVTAAAIGAIAGGVLVLAGRSIVDIPTALVALAAMGLIRKVLKLPEPVIVAAAAIIGFVAFPGLHGEEHDEGNTAGGKYDEQGPGYVWHCFLWLRLGGRSDHGGNDQF